MLLLAVLLFSAACEDPVPTDYTPDTIIQALITVDKPIKNIIIMRTLSIQDTFSLDKSLISDAEVYIYENTDTFRLKFRSEGEKGYYYDDTTYLIKPQTRYNFVAVVDGVKMTGSTITPLRFYMTKATPDSIYYPKDTVKLPTVDSLKLEWTSAGDVAFYLIAVNCQDTLNYGKYLSPPRDEKNRRIERSNIEDHHFYEITSWAFINATEVPVVWSIFKWYGKHKAIIYAPDDNYLNWFKQYQIKSSYDPLLGSITNGKGFFGSVSTAECNFILIKNQP